MSVTLWHARTCLPRLLTNQSFSWDQTWRGLSGGSTRPGGGIGPAHCVASAWPTPSRKGVSAVPVGGGGSAPAHGAIVTLHEIVSPIATLDSVSVRRGTRVPIPVGGEEVAVLSWHARARTCQLGTANPWFAVPYVRGFRQYPSGGENWPGTRAHASREMENSQCSPTCTIHHTGPSYCFTRRSYPVMASTRRGVDNCRYRLTMAG